ncbi:MAG: sulfite exporter TauE/SafE family protein, partial [Polyangiales bacterium]
MEALAHIATPEFAVAFAISFVAAALHSTVGFGFALISVPLLSLLDPLFAPVPQLFVVWPLTVAIVWRERHAIEVRSTLWIFAGRVPGALIGVGLLKVLSDARLDVLMSLMVLVGVFAVVSRGTFRRTPAREFGAGVASGTMAMVSAIGGPPIALLYR